MHNSWKKILLFMYALLYLPMRLYSAKYGLLIGISRYNTQQTSWGNINGENDIKLLSPILEKLDYDLSILTGKHATAKNIRDALNNLANKSQTGDTVYLHFSCHGQPVEDTNGDGDLIVKNVSFSLGNRKMLLDEMKNHYARERFFQSLTHKNIILEARLDWHHLSTEEICFKLSYGT